MGNAGIAATVRDPTGATLALWQPLDHDGTWIAKEPGTLAGFQLRVDDLAPTSTFWDTAVGWKLDQRGGIWSGANRVGSWRQQRNGDRVTTASPWLIDLRTDDLDAALHRATRLGATILDAHGLLCDPAGATFKMVTADP